jgi:hypothetical protein
VKNLKEVKLPSPFALDVDSDLYFKLPMPSLVPSSSPWHRDVARILLPHLKPLAPRGHLTPTDLPVATLRQQRSPTPSHRRLSVSYCAAAVT